MMVNFGRFVFLSVFFFYSKGKTSSNLACVSVFFTNELFVVTGALIGSWRKYRNMIGDLGWLTERSELVVSKPKKKKMMYIKSVWLFVARSFTTYYRTAIGKAFLFERKYFRTVDGDESVLWSSAERFHFREGFCKLQVFSSFLPTGVREIAEVDRMPRYLWNILLKNGLSGIKTLFEQFRWDEFAATLICLHK